MSFPSSYPNGRTLTKEEIEYYKEQEYLQSLTQEELCKMTSQVITKINELINLGYNDPFSSMAALSVMDQLTCYKFYKGILDGMKK